MAQLKLKKSDLVRIFFRSFFLQAVWNFKSMLSVGLSFSMVPVVKRLEKNRAEMGRVLKRYLYFFNAHPYLSSFALGALARLEQDRANGLIVDEEKIDKFKNALIGPLGAIGDFYFWATIKPAAILTGVAGVIFFEELTSKILSVVLMLVLYNLPHLHIRISGLLKGFNSGYDTYKLLRMEHFTRVAVMYKILGAFMLGMIAATLFYKSGILEYRYLAVFAVSIILGYFLRRKRKSVQLSVLVTLGIAIIIGAL